MESRHIPYPKLSAFVVANKIRGIYFIQKVVLFYEELGLVQFTISSGKI